MKKAILLLTCLVMSLSVWAVRLHFEGTAAGKYPVVISMDYDGYIVKGKYAYKSTLKKNGKKASSYLYFNGNIDDIVYVKDSKGNVVEKWKGCWIHPANKLFRCIVYSNNGKFFDLDAQLTKNYSKYF